jgi:hypothetical protein
VTIHYTLDGADPTSASQQYEAPVQIKAADAKDGVVTLKTIAVKGEVSSAVRTVEYRIGQITWTAAANGAEDTNTSTAIIITFTGGSVTDLGVEHITVINGTGEVSKGELDGNSLGITVTKAGTVSLRIRKAGVVSEPTEGPVPVHKKVDVNGTAWKPLAYGTSGSVSSKFIVLDFSGEQVTGLTKEHITVASDEESENSGSVDTGDLTDSGTGYSLAITVKTEGDVLVTIKKDGIDDRPHTVKVYKDTKAPGPVTDLKGEAKSDTEITLTWTKPGDEDFNHVEISYIAADAEPDTKPVTVKDKEGEIKDSPYTVGGLAAATEYKFTVKAVDNDGNTSVSAEPNESVKTKESPKASVKVKFSGFKDEAVEDIKGDKDTLSWKAKDSLEVSLGGIDGAYTCEYSLDDEKARTQVVGSVITLKATQLSVKKHTLTVFITKGNVTHTKKLTFTVVGAKE